jgi:hypothetical protein
MTTVKDDLHALVDTLTEDEADYYLREMRSKKDDPLWVALLNAPYDDEPVTEEEEAQVEEARQDLRRAQGRPLEEVWADIERERRGA